MNWYDKGLKEQQERSKQEARTFRIFVLMLVAFIALAYGLAYMTPAKAQAGQCLDEMRYAYDAGKLEASATFLAECEKGFVWVHPQTKAVYVCQMTEAQL